MFVSLEGIDGVGKTTQARLLAERLRARGHEVVECREPGGTQLGERVRALLLEHGDWAVGPRAEALLFAAARAQIVDEVIRPALARGAWVVCDRFLDSSIAYQGYGRGLGAEEVERTSLFATGGIVPDRTVLLEGVERLGELLDRMESSGDGFRETVSQSFRRIAAAHPERIRVVDGMGTVAEVRERIWAVVDGH